MYYLALFKSLRFSNLELLSSELKVQAFQNDQNYGIRIPWLNGFHTSKLKNY
jgi:hypothetical protein